jgi:hypothetical protein
MVQTVICCGPGCFAHGIKEVSPPLYYKIYIFRMVNIIGAKRGQDAITISAKKQLGAIAQKPPESMELIPLVRPSPERTYKPSSLFGRSSNSEKKPKKLEDTPYRKRRVIL